MDLSVIKERISIIERLEQENRVSRELLKDALENSETYKDVAAKAKESATEKKRIKDTLMNESGNKSAVESIKENMEEISTLKEILSAELMEYYQEKKTDEIESADGTPRKFKISIKLTRTNSNNDRDHYGQFEPKAGL